MRVAALGSAVLAGLKAGGCAGIIKHIPGHGRAVVDSHLELPVVSASADELETDLRPFIKLNEASMAMTAHVVFEAWDRENCATLSPYVIEEIIRKRIGFDGLLMTDDIDMKALTGTPAEKACVAIAAGCDIVLDCWGRFDEMVSIVEALPEISEAALVRLGRAMEGIGVAKAVDKIASLIAKRDALLAYTT
jgi:beta-N-acetylhexosaminidase